MFENFADRLVPDCLSGDCEPRAAGLCSAVTGTAAPVAVAGTSDATKVWEIAASAAGDIAAVIPHGMAAAPGKDQVSLVPLTADFYVKQYCVGVIDATNINLVMTNAGGTAPVACRVILRAHTINR